jgi:hypothetical protein
VQESPEAYYNTDYQANPQAFWFGVCVCWEFDFQQILKWCSPCEWWGHTLRTTSWTALWLTPY